MILKQVIFYDNFAGAEATWVDEEGNQVKCHSYHPTQMDMIRADLGADAAQYEEQLAKIETNYIPDPAPPVQIPQTVTALQGLLAIDQAGLATAYETWANAPERTFAEKAFINKAQIWGRTDATLNQAAVVIGISSDQLDQMFLLASTL